MSIPAASEPREFFPPSNGYEVAITVAVRVMFRVSWCRPVPLYAVPESALREQI